MWSALSSFRTTFCNFNQEWCLKKLLFLNHLGMLLQKTQILLKFEELYFPQFLHWKWSQLMRMADIVCMYYTRLHYWNMYLQHQGQSFKMHTQFYIWYSREITFFSTKEGHVPSTNEQTIEICCLLHKDNYRLDVDIDQNSL